MNVRTITVAGESATLREHQGRVTGYVLPRVRDIRRGGSAALDHCWVACGRLDAYYEQGVQQWDYAAGALIVEEAGGATGGIVQGALAGMRFAAGPSLFEPLRALVLEAEERGITFVPNTRVAAVEDRRARL